jgi:hypothetical protein
MKGNYIHGNTDHGDLFDNVKWNLDDSKLIKFFIDGFLYKVNTKDSAVKLHKYRNKIDILCKNILNAPLTDIDPECIRIFLDIHMSHNGRYFLSEIPPSKEGKKFNGLNVPKLRIFTNDKSIGKDKNLRASYRDIYMSPTLTEHMFTETLIHELAHTMCNHVQWHDDDHGKDFKRCEKFIKSLWPK